MQIVFRKNKEGVHIRCAALVVLSGIARHRPYALGDREVEKLVANTIKVPPCSRYAASVVTAVALQLFAYYFAKARGCEIDRPRHLAKSVTVE